MLNFRNFSFALSGADFFENSNFEQAEHLTSSKQNKCLNAFILRKQNRYTNASSGCTRARRFDNDCVESNFAAKIRVVSLNFKVIALPFAKNLAAKTLSRTNGLFAESDKSFFRFGSNQSAFLLTALPRRDSVFISNSFFLSKIFMYFASRNARKIRL